MREHLGRSRLAPTQRGRPAIVRSGSKGVKRRRRRRKEGVWGDKKKKRWKIAALGAWAAVWLA